jgi:predicted ATP-dependent protease
MRGGKAASAGWHSTDLHVHVPAGAIPKDGPSAGVSMLSAMISVLTGKTVDPATGMTGEITLSGRVLPVGGIREKTLAAYRAGLKRIILPARNEQDLEEVPEDIRKEIEFVFIKTIDELVEIVFGGKGKPRRAARKARKKPRAAGAKARKKKTTGKRGKVAKRKPATRTSKKKTPATASKRSNGKSIKRGGAKKKKRAAARRR